MINYTLEDGSQVEFDYLTVYVKTECLPDLLNVTTALSTPFTDKDLAEYSLAHIQKTIPHAYLSGSFSLDSTESEILEKQRITMRDDQYLELFQLGGKS